MIYIPSRPEPSEETKARVDAAMRNPRAVHMRERLAAAIRYAFHSNPFGVKHALGMYMFSPDGIREGHLSRADALLVACDELGLRIIDEFDDAEDRR